MKFELDAKDFNRALKVYPENLTKELRRASKRSASVVESTAKDKHRFTTRTGKLVKSIKGYGGVGAIKESRSGFLGKIVDKIFDIRSDASAYVNLVLHDEGHPMGTQYGKYVHQGQRSWGADKFIDSSMKNNIATIKSNWARAINKANKDF